MKSCKTKVIRTSESRCLLLLCVMLSVYLLENLPFIKINSSTYFAYIIKPLIWGGVIFIVWLFPRVRAKGRIRFQNDLKWWVGYLAVFYILFTFLGGLIEHFGKSPYDFSPLGIVKNVIVLGSALIARELIRAYLVNNLANKHPILTMGIIAILMTLLNLSLNRIGSLKESIEILQYIGEIFLPELLKNILVTYLVFIGGPTLSIIYLGILNGVVWICPILPDLRWITTALIGILCPVFSLMIIQYIYLGQSKSPKIKNVEKENPLGWILTSVISIAMVWFVVGVFPIQPSVIVTGSMKPMIQPGDMVLVKKMDGNEVKMGDVIQFKRDSIYIFHRIIEIKEEEKQLKYKTKGDNNSGPDSDLVPTGDVKGKVIYVIPKIGWPTLIFKSKNSVPKEKVEF
ncbi:signal peptidase I [Clostridium estertheticum]|uniref:signal peptidase I n=1 Tax=Clostridium estertheticum TaxID=238834 RepID=UPI0013E9547C|nr:signal peptidase I [Clostridium estertheticum]MBZ9689204.1 signal peptidase I [Clostridium estertheticum]